MQVKTLIKKLSKFNPEAEVYLNEYGGDVALFVSAFAHNNKKVWFEGEHDIDMRSELSARLDAIKNGEISEHEMYSDMLELGITVEMVRKYMGDEAADQMQEYCNKHSLETENISEKETIGCCRKTF